ncbi:MAG: hypothetical protein V4542_05805 [Pseudomonadota bacterium]
MQIATGLPLKTAVGSGDVKLKVVKRRVSHLEQPLCRRVCLNVKRQAQPEG